jgi:hypothetical protein
MADNVQAEAVVSGGSVFLAASFSFSGDTVFCPGSFVGILSGSEGSWTYTLSPGGAGAVTAGTPRMTLASDDPAVSQITSLNGKVTACNTGAVVLAAGTAAVGKLAANDGVDIGDVTINNASIAVTGTFWQATQPVSGSVSITGGVTVSSHDVTNAGTFAVQVDGAALTSLQLIDDIVQSEDAAHSSGQKGVMALAVRSDAGAALAGTDGDYIPLTTTQFGALWVAQSGTFTVGISAGQTLSNVTTVQNCFVVGKQNADDAITSAPVLCGGYASAAAPTAVSADGDSVFSWHLLNGQQVIQPAFSGVLATTGNGASGTGVQRVTIANDSTGQIIALGAAAHDAASSGAPVRIGAKAETSLSSLTLVADGDATDLFAGVDGVLITRPHCNLEGIVTGQATNTDGTSTECIAAQSTGIKTYLTTIILANSHATTNCTVDIKDGSTVKMTIPVPANGGAVVNLPVPLPGTAATAWNFDPSAAVSTISCSMVGFKSKV